MSVVLGLNDPWHDSTFCVYSPGAIIHIEMERFTRVKYERLNPVIGFISLYPQLIETIETVAIEEGEFLAPHVRRLITSGNAGIAEFVERMISQTIGSISLGRAVARNEIEQITSFARRVLKLSDSTSFYGHHVCHAANSFFSSNFVNALCVVLDGGGLEVVGGRRITVHGSVWRFRRADHSIPQPAMLECTHSIGLAWDRVRALLGLQWGEEGTVMAMAAYGKKCTECDEFVRNDLLWLPNYVELPKDLARSAQQYLGDFAAKIDSEEQKYSVAFALQKETEARVRQFLAVYLDNFTGDLCLSGGVFLNCQITGRIKQWFPGIRRVYIPPAPYDGGISIGAAQLASHIGQSSHGVSHLADQEFAPFATGPTFSRVEIIAAIRAIGCSATRVEIQDVVDLLDNGAVLGLFCGAAESGRRALGHRSIIADPRNSGMRDHINNVIKHRQWFRPFAPMILAERVSDWFDVDKAFASPYMSFAVPVKAEKRSRIPAVIHEDGTARVQTVHKSLSPDSHALLQAWNRVSGVPLLLNTSFNDREPIVQLPSEALATLLRLPLNGIYFSDFAILATKGSATAVGSGLSIIAK